HLELPGALGIPTFEADAVERDEKRRAIASVLAVDVHAAAPHLVQDAFEKQLVGAEHPVERETQKGHAEPADMLGLDARQPALLAAQADDGAHAEGVEGLELLARRLSAAVDSVGDAGEARRAGSALQERQRALGIVGDVAHRAALGRAGRTSSK